jgi:hypothetical protein
MAKKRGLAGYKKRRGKRKNSMLVPNPPMMTDLKDYILPGFAAYAGTKLLTRLAYQTLQPKLPRAGKHVAALSSLGAFAAVWWLGHRWKKIAKYHDGIVIGAAIAAGQCLARTYLPARYSWIISDYAIAPAQAAQPAMQPLPEPRGAAIDIPEDDDELGDLGVLSGGMADIYDDEGNTDSGRMMAELESAGSDDDGLGDLFS